MSWNRIKLMKIWISSTRKRSSDKISTGRNSQIHLLVDVICGRKPLSELFPSRNTYSFLKTRLWSSQSTFSLTSLQESKWGSFWIIGGPCEMMEEVLEEARIASICQTGLLCTWETEVWSVSALIPLTRSTAAVRISRKPRHPKRENPPN